MKLVLVIIKITFEVVLVSVPLNSISDLPWFEYFHKSQLSPFEMPHLQYYPKYRKATFLFPLPQQSLHHNALQCAIWNLKKWIIWKFRISFYLNQSMFLENSSTTFWISIQKSIIVSKWALGCISLSPPVPSSIWSPDAPINVAEMVFIFSIEVLYASLSRSSSISLITSFKTLKCHFSHQKDAIHFTW